MAGIFFRPSILAPQIGRGASGYVAQMLEGIDAVLVEDDPAWTVYLPSTGGLGESLGELGFVERK
jgi:hypothetical protein